MKLRRIVTLLIITAASAAGIWGVPSAVQPASCRENDYRGFSSGVRSGNLAGEKVSLSEYKGRVVLLNFWGYLVQALYAGNAALK